MRILSPFSFVLTVLVLNSQMTLATPPDDAPKPPSNVQQNNSPDPVAVTHVKVDERFYNPIYAHIRDDGKVEVNHRKPTTQPVDPQAPSAQK